MKLCIPNKYILMSKFYPPQIFGKTVRLMDDAVLRHQKKIMSLYIKFYLQQDVNIKDRGVVVRLYTSIFFYKQY